MAEDCEDTGDVGKAARGKVARDKQLNLNTKRMSRKFLPGICPLEACSLWLTNIFN
jgi:hypothetical protein